MSSSTFGKVSPNFMKESLEKTPKFREILYSDWFDQSHQLLFRLQSRSIQGSDNETVLV